MNSDKANLVKALSPIFKKRGWKKKAATWCYPKGQFAVVFNLQKSSWGGGVYYLNIAVFTDEAAKSKIPAEYEGDIIGRFEDLFPESAKKVRQFRYDSKSSAADSQIELLVDVLSDSRLNALERLSDGNRLLEFLASTDSKRFGVVTGTAKRVERRLIQMEQTK